VAHLLVAGSRNLFQALVLSFLSPHSRQAGSFLWYTSSKDMKFKAPQKYFISSFLLSASFVLFPSLTLASYQPGQTLDPACPPSDGTCVVVPNTTSSSFIATSTTATSTFAGNTSVGGIASSTNTVVSNTLTIGSLSGILKAVAGVVASALVNLSGDVTGILGVSNGGTGTSTSPTYGQVLVGNGSGGYNLLATSSLGITGGGSSSTWGAIAGTLANQTDLASALNATLSLTSWYATTTDGLAQGTTNKYFSNTLAQTALSVSGLPLTYSGGVIGINQATLSQPGYLAAADFTTFNNKISSTSLSGIYPLSYNSTNGVFATAFSTTTANTFSALNTFNGGITGNILTINTSASIASTTLIGNTLLTNATTTSFAISNISSALLKTLSSGAVVAAVAGVDYATPGGGSGAFSFTPTTFGATAANATSTLIGFTNGLYATASSTFTSNVNVIGAAIFNSKVGIGTTSPAALFSVSGGDTRLKETVDSPTALVVENAVGSSTFQVSTLDTSSDLLQVATSTGSIFFNITSSGNVGISTSSPYSTFSISGQSGKNVFAISTSSDAVTAFRVSQNGNLHLSNGAGIDIGNGVTPPGNSLIVAGNIGIGTTSPGSLLSVQGVANWTNATSTYYSTGGINLSGGCFAIGGTCITGGGGGAVTSISGTANQITASASTGAITLSLPSLVNLTNASSSVLSVSGEAYFGTASTTNLVISGITTGSGQCLQINGAGQVSGTGSACGGSGSTPGGASGAIQFNSSGSFGGASNLFWDSGNNRLGIGTSSPYALLSVATPNGASGSVTTLFSIASSTSIATTTLFSISNTGGAQFTLASSTFSVGANGTTNPAFQIFASTTNAATGLALTSNVAGNGALFAVTSSGATENLTINPKGATGKIILAVPGGATGITVNNNNDISFTQSSGTKYDFFANNFLYTPSAATNASSIFNIKNSGGGALTAATEVPIELFNSTAGATWQHANSSIALQRDFLIAPEGHSFATYNSGNTITDLATFSVAGAPIMTASGNGTTTNAYSLLIGSSTATTQLNASTTNSYGLAVWANGGAVNNYAAIFSGGNVGIGTTTPYSRFTVWGTDAASSTLSFNVVNSASTTLFAVFDGGNAQLSGTLTQSSDRRLKANIQGLDASTSLAAINSLSPVAYDWLDPEKGGVRQYGFIAQDVQKVFPNLVSTTSPTTLTPDGTLGLNYLGLIAPIVKAVQQLAADIASLSSRVLSLEAAVADFANSFTTKQLCVADNDGKTCISRSQLRELLGGQPAVQISASAPLVIGDTTTPPSINIQGSNPATVHVGDTYTDLGALVHDNQGHDLSYRIFFNGVLSANIQIDTSVVATDTIDYVATDTWGNTSTSTRTIVIQTAPASESAVTSIDQVATSTSH